MKEHKAERRCVAAIEQHNPGVLPNGWYFKDAFAFLVLMIKTLCACQQNCSLPVEQKMQEN